MDKEKLKTHLSSAYYRQHWIELLNGVFNSGNVFEAPQPAQLPGRNWTDAWQLGSFSTHDGYDLAVFEIHVSDKIHLDRNRVTLRNLLTKYYKQADGIFAVFVQGNRWRFSFISQLRVYDEDIGEWIRVETEPKRYTYVLGDGEAVKTATERFYKLTKGKKVKFEDIKSAFSVEKLSKRFFDEYKKQYDKFVGHLTGKIWTKKGVKKVGDRISQFHFFFKATSDHEKEARDFVKKLLGRIVFLYFVQKKQWLGASTMEFKDGNPDFIYHLFKQVPEDQKDQFYPQWLTNLFFDTLNRDDDHALEMPDGTTVYIPFLNGGLFEKDDTDKNTESLPLPGYLFSNPKDTESPNTRGFLDFLSAYNFTIHEDSPGDHTIAVDPEMLGHIFENLLEDNKDKGAYYTPKPIVHYMCQESLIEFLLTELTAEDTENSEKEELRGHLEDLIKKQEAGELVGFTEPILKSLKEVKVCDPAIGSGAFPMGILQEIYLVVETLHHLSPDNVRTIWELPDDDWHPADVKKQIIQNSIYGVDIEKGAVDIARLRFWLSLIVDELEPEPLPNLDYKIIAGNSLLSKFEGKHLEIKWNSRGSNEYEKKIIAIGNKLANAQKEYFQPKADKINLSSEIRGLKIDLITAQLELSKKKFELESALDGTLFEKTKRHLEKELAVKVELEEYKNLEKRLQELKNDKSKPLDYFDWKLDFPEVLNPHLSKNPGFDIVIANPPYLRVQEIQKVMPEDKKILEKKYKNAKASYDLANLFFELAVNLGKPESSNCFIFPHKFFNSASTKVFRDYLMNGKYIDRIAHFGANMIFNDADTYTCITLFSGKANDGFWIQKFGLGEDYIRLMNQSEKYSFVPYEKLKLASNLYGSNQWILFNTEEEYDVFKKIYSAGATIEDKFEDVFQGIATSKDTLYVLESVIEDEKFYHGEIFRGDQQITVEKEYFKPLLKGADIHRYALLETDKYVFFPYKVENGSAEVVELDELEQNYPKTYDYVMRNEKKFKSRESGRAGRMEYWYEYIYPKNLTKFEQEKLSSMEICSNHPNVSLDPEGFHHATTVYSWVKKKEVKESYELFLSIANSDLMWWFLMNSGDTLRGDARRFKSNYLNPFPLPKSVSEQKDQIFKKKVEAVISAKAEGKDTTALEQQIDTLVYKLYNLTWEEVQVVDPEFGMSEEEYEGVGVE